MKQIRTTQEERQEIIRLYQEGFSLREIDTKLGRRGTAWYQVRAAGIPLRPKKWPKGKPHGQYQHRKASECYQCGREFYLWPHEIRKSKIQQFCSRNCLWNWRRNQVGFGIQRGYRVVRGRPEHVLIVEKVLGRPLKSGEVVHHINGDKADNRNCNLLVCTQSYHRWLHGRMSNLYQREHFSLSEQGGEATCR